MPKRAQLVAAFLALVIFAGAAWQVEAGQSQVRAPAAPAADATRQAVKGYTLPPEKYRQAVTLNRAFYWGYFLGFFYGLLIYFALLRWKLAPKYRDWAERASRRGLVQAMVFAPLLLLTIALLNLPRGIIGQWLVLKYGLSVQSWPSWVWDWSKRELLRLLFGTFLVWMLYSLVRRSRRGWWFYLWLATIPLTAVVVYLAPLVVDPLFYRFEPLSATQPQLVAQLERVVARGGVNIPPERMFEMKASAKLRETNAYVTGFSGSKRVVVWDTTLENSTPAEVLAVFGHELGHYALGHIGKGMILFEAALLAALFVGARLYEWLLRRRQTHWAIRGPDDWASLPVLLLLASVFSFLAAPVGNAYSRHLEHEADVYGLEVTHGVIADAGEVAAGSFQKLGETNLADPAPSRWIVLWLYSHDPIDARIRFARTYDPWAPSRTPRFIR